MAGWSGNGNFTRVYSWTNDAANGIDIIASRMDADTNNITLNGFGNCLTRDGQGSATANLPMNGFLHTGVGNAAAAGNYVAAGQIPVQGLTYAIGAGTGNAVTATITPAIAALTDGLRLQVKAPAGNSITNPTFSPNGQTATVITKGANVALAIGDYAAGQILDLQYIASVPCWSLLNPGSPSGTSLNFFITPEQYGAIGNGTTSDSAALNAAFAAAAAAFKPVLLSKTYYIPTAAPVTIPSNSWLTGPGTLLGDSVGFSAAPTSSLVSLGTLGTPVSLGTSAITVGTASFTVNNSLAPNDIILLRNHSGSADSRMEILVVATASGTGFTTRSTTVANYPSSTSAQFQKMAPVSNILLDGITLTNLIYNPQYAAVNCFRQVTAYSCYIGPITCIYGDWNYKLFDGQQASAAFMNPIGSSRNFRISGNFTGGVGVSDNGIVKVLGAQKFSIDVVISSLGNNGGFLHGVMIDEYYASSPFGADHLPTQEYKISVVASSIANGNAVSIVSTAAAADVVQKYGYVSGTFGNGGMNINNAAHIIIDGDFSNSGFNCNNSTDICFEQYNGPTPSVATSTLIRGIKLPWSPVLAGDGTAGTFSASGSNSGWYKIDGQSVLGGFRINGTLSGAVGNMSIVGLPIADAGSAGELGSVTFTTYAGVTALDTGCTGLNATIAVGGTTALLIEFGPGASAQQIAVGKFSGTIDLIGTFEYHL